MLEMESTTSASWRKSAEIASCMFTGHNVLLNTKHSLECKRWHSERISIKARSVTWKLDTHDARLDVVSNEWGRDQRWTQDLENKMETLLTRRLLSGLWLQLLCSLSPRQIPCLGPLFSSLLFWQLVARCIEKLQENGVHSGFYTHCYDCF